MDLATNSAGNLEWKKIVSAYAKPDLTGALWAAANMLISYFALFYLRRADRENRLFHIQPLTLLSSLQCLKWRVYDEANRRLEGREVLRLFSIPREAEGGGIQHQGHKEHEGRRKDDRARGRPFFSRGDCFVAGRRRASPPRLLATTGAAPGAASVHGRGVPESCTDGIMCEISHKGYWEESAKRDSRKTEQGVDHERDRDDASP